MKFSLTIATALFLATATGAKAEPPKVLVFDFYFDNTSMEPTSPDEDARIKKISEDLRTALQKSGEYEVVRGDEKKFISVQDSGKCSTQQLAAAQADGAPFVACGLVQKVSNLILNLNLVIEDSKTGQQLRGGSVDIRGNTDVSWDRGLRYLIMEHLFNKS